MKTKKTEKQIQNGIIKYLLIKGFLVIRINGGGCYDKTGRFIYFYNVENYPGTFKNRHSGLSDIIATKKNFTFYIEIKKPGGRQSKEQKNFEHLCKSMNIEYLLIDDVLKGVQSLENLIK